MVVLGWTLFAFGPALILRGSDSTRCWKHSSEISSLARQHHSCCWQRCETNTNKLLTIVATCRCRNLNFSDQAVFFQCSFTQCRWTCSNSILSFLFLGSGTQCGLLLLQGLTCREFRDGLLLILVVLLIVTVDFLSFRISVPILLRCQQGMFA